MLYGLVRLPGAEKRDPTQKVTLDLADLGQYADGCLPHPDLPLMRPVRPSPPSACASHNRSGPISPMPAASRRAHRQPCRQRKPYPDQVLAFTSRSGFLLSLTIAAPFIRFRGLRTTRPPRQPNPPKPQGARNGTGRSFLRPVLACDTAGQL